MKLSKDEKWLISSRVPECVEGKYKWSDFINFLTAKPFRGKTAYKVYCYLKDKCGIDLLEKVDYINDYLFYNCQLIKEVTIPSNILRIGRLSFSSCNSLGHVLIPDTVLDIDRYAFSGCESLKFVKISNNVSWIRSHTFSECTSLKDVFLPDELYEIEQYAFYDCKSLEKITIPQSVKCMSNVAFSCCESLKNIIYTGTKQQFDKIKIVGSWISLPEDCIVTCQKDGAVIKKNEINLLEN